MSLYRMVYDKASHLPVELEHKAMWALKSLNLNWTRVAHARIKDLNEIDEFLLWSYESVFIYKTRMKHFHDRKIFKKDFALGNWIFTIQLKFPLVSQKAEIQVVRTIQSVPFYSNGAIGLEEKNGHNSK